MDGWTTLIADADEDAVVTGGPEARELGRGLLRLLAERRGKSGEDAAALLRHALTVLEAASWYVDDALEAVETRGAELADLRGRL